jgi:hypothetical protein
MLFTTTLASVTFFTITFVPTYTELNLTEKKLIPCFV